VTVTLEQQVKGSAQEDVPLPLLPGSTGADRTFHWLLVGASLIVLVAIVAIAAFLANFGGPTVRHSGLSIFSKHWAPLANPAQYGMVALLVGTIMIAALALLIALPISVAAALLVNEYAPRQFRRPLTALIDLLAALPSLIYGIWGLTELSNQVYGTTNWLGQHAKFIPIFRVDGPIGNSIFLCGLVVGVMIIPIITSRSRAVMSQVPRDACEAALALGGTKWGMVTDVVLPFARPGIIGGALLGLGRALGETIAVLLILSQTNVIQTHILVRGGGQIPALIAADFTSVNTATKQALALAGLVLFATVLTINVLARSIVKRSGRAA
jgi:phosphate transport system permease protein